jgi:transposase
MPTRLDWAPGPRVPSQRWLTFVRNHARALIIHSLSADHLTRSVQVLARIKWLLHQWWGYSVASRGQESVPSHMVFLLEAVRKVIIALTYCSHEYSPLLTEIVSMTAPTRKPSLTDLTDEQWAILQPLIPPAKPGGRPRAVAMRELIHTLLSLHRTGCQWDMLPHDLLPKSTVYEYFSQWRTDGTWQSMMDGLRAAVRTPQAPSHEPTPSAARRDSPTVQPTDQGGERGSDGGKKITGRKRHVGVDTLGLLWAVVVTSAAIDEAGAAPPVLTQLGKASYPR